MHKKGSGYDVPIALGIIAASRQRNLPLIDDFIVMGELGLDGGVRDVPGALPIVELASNLGLRGCILPRLSAMEALEFENVEVYGVDTLEDVLRVLSGEEDCADLLVDKTATPTGRGNVNDEDMRPSDSSEQWSGMMDFSEIIGQDAAKRGVEIAAAGGHNVIIL